ncbi:hypothetical protein R3P38DRAFT_2910689 [Favolaschia claudopus]|uniref:DUF6534 domain-containing protein n=1 Tax=Favolaschia claudopus TaxID=2862362 RepID=A0AAW0CB60_9AGAR
MDPAPKADLFNPQSTIGAFQISALISFVFFGILTCQTYTYFSRFSKDSWAIKFLVVFAYANEVGHAICTGHAIYTYTILDYGHPERLLDGAVPKSLGASLLFGLAIVFCVQSCFAYKIYALYKKPYIPVPCFAASTAGAICGLVLFVNTILMTTLRSGIHTQKWLLTIFWALTAVNDLAITAALSFFFIKHRSAVHKSTKVLVDRLTVWTLETGLLTSIVAMTCFACFTTNPDNFVWVAFFVLHPQLYSMSLMASLHSRATLRDATSSSIRFQNVPLSLDGIQMTVSKVVASNFGLEGGTDNDSQDV